MRIYKERGRTEEKRDRMRERKKREGAERGESRERHK
jgi:hypothetical protein